MDALERLTVDIIASEDLIASEHVLRYQLARQIVSGSRIVDLACGVGYGTALLAGDGRQVVGVDVAAEAIDAARSAYGETPGVRFEQADAVAYLEGLSAEDVDAIVCFEGLEHLPDLDAAVEELVRLAQAGVELVLSVPNSVGIGEENDFHVTEFGPESARELAGRFDGAILLAQQHAEGSVIVHDEPVSGEAACELVLAERTAFEDAGHFLIVVGVDAGRVEAAVPRGRARLALAPHHARYMRQLERANRELWQTNQRLARGHIGVYDSAAAAMVARIAAAEAEARAAKEKAEADIAFMQEQVRIANADAQAARDAAAAAELARDQAERRYRGLRSRRSVRAALRVAELIPMRRPRA